MHKSYITQDENETGYIVVNGNAQSQLFDNREDAERAMELDNMQTEEDSPIEWDCYRHRRCYI